MRLTTQAMLLRVAFYASLFGVVAGAYERNVWMAGGSVFLWGIIARVSKDLRRRAGSRVEALAMAGDVEGTREYLRGFGRPNNARAKWGREAAVVSAMMFAGDYRTAAAEWRALLSSAQPSDRAFALNNLAWSLTQGKHPQDVEQAVSFAREALRLAEAEKSSSLANCLGTLGTALTFSGAAAEAIPVLERALSLGGTEREMAIRNFYLSEALRRAGDEARAQEAFQRATALADGSDLVKKELERLAKVGS